MPDLNELGFLLFFGLALSLFLLPTFIARHRRLPQRWQVMAVNLFLGATLLGWVVALVWALAPKGWRSGLRWP